MSYYKDQELIPENREARIRDTYIKCSRLEAENKELKKLIHKSIELLGEVTGSLADCIYEIHDANLKVSTETDEIRFNKASQFIEETKVVLNDN